MAASAALSFSLHYYKPQVAYGIVLTLLFFVVIFGLGAARQWRAKMKGQIHEPSWFVFLFVTSALSWIAGVSVGEANYHDNLSSYYQILGLNMYSSVDPSEFTGEQVLDAGRIVFSNSSYVDTTMSSGYKKSDVYCVAPIKTDVSFTTYDFWAVGINCCSGTSPDFHCDDYNKPEAHSGMRLLDDSEEAFFRLAVQTAESLYNIKASHPLYFTWMYDVSMKSNEAISIDVFLFASISWTVFVFLLTIAMILALSRFQT